MGLLSFVGKVVSAPIKVLAAPVSIPLKMISDRNEKKWQEKAKVRAVIDTRFPDNYREFYESDGYKTDIIKGRVVVWEKGITDKDIARLKAQMAL